MLGLYIWSFCLQGPIGLDGKPVSGSLGSARLLTVTPLVLL